MTVKLERLNSNLAKELSYILANEVKDEIIHHVTITGCDITRDLSFAKVYYTILDSSKRKEAEVALKRASSFIRGKVSERVDIRHTPELRFIYDNTIEYGNRIERKIEELHNKDN